MELSEIVQKIIHNRCLYWDTGSSDISDNEYDQLLISLEAEDPDHELLTGIESGTVEDSKKVKHKVKLYSLNKIFSATELGEWMAKVARNNDERFVIQPKYDGMACRYYADSRVLATRGQDGVYGEDISHILPIVSFSGSSNIDFDHSLDIEGELLCRKSEFKRTAITRSSGDKYKTERNLVAGVSNNDNISPFQNKIELTLMNYNTFSYVRTLNNISSDWDAICKEFNNLDYPTDGVVIKLEDSLYSTSLGYTAKFPRGQIALKFPDEIKEASLLDVVFQTGKKKITPVAIIEPTLIDGVTVSRVTLHNTKFCLDYNLMIGDTLKIIRSGKVIPKVIGVIKNTEDSKRKPIIIEACPSCGSDVEYKSPNYECTAADCDGSIKKKLAYAASVLGLDEFGPGTINKIVDKFKPETIVDVLNLEYSDFMKLDGFADASAQNAAASIDELLNRQIQDCDLFACLSVDGIGSSVWKSILTKYYPEDVLDLEYSNLISVDGIGDERAKVIENAADIHSDTILTLLDMFTVSKSKDLAEELPKICFSGNFPHHKSTYAQIAKRKGFEVTSGVSKKLAYLVNNGATTSKVSKARQYGVRVITEQEFLNL